MAISDSHKKRIISGLIMAAALVGCLVLGGWPLRALVSVVSVLALWEFYQMVWPGFTNKPDKIAGYLAGLAVCLLSSFNWPYIWSLALVGAVALYAALSFLVSYGSGNEQADLGKKSLVLFGVLYLPMALQLALHISLAEQFIVILAAVGSDTGAYYAGSTLGKHKIWPRVSPKKSWEGSVGGMCASMIILAVYCTMVEVPGLGHVPFWLWGIIGVILSMAAQIGDFFESALKRATSVKDSSNLIPGHGGLMDRLDSIVFVLPVFMFIRLLLLSLNHA